MLLNKLKHLGLLVVLEAAVVSGTLWQARNLTWADEPPAKPAPAPAEVPKPAGPGHILYSRDGKLYLMDPDGKNERRIELPDMGPPPPTICLSPDGGSLAFWTAGDDFQPVVWVRALDSKGFGTKFEFKEAAGFVNLFWSPNGQELPLPWSSRLQWSWNSQEIRRRAGTRRISSPNSLAPSGFRIIPGIVRECNHGRTVRSEFDAVL